MQIVGLIFMWTLIGMVLVLHLPHCWIQIASVTVYMSPLSILNTTTPLTLFCEIKNVLVFPHTPRLSNYYLIILLDIYRMLLLF